jgi:Predicted membrane protein
MNTRLSILTEPSESLMHWLVLGTTYVLIALFLMGVVDVLAGLYDLVVTRSFTDPFEIVQLLDTVLLLLIIVEVHRTLLAYVRNEPVVRIVIGAGIIAIAREIISFQIGDFGSSEDALIAAAALAVLLVVLASAFVFIPTSPGFGTIYDPDTERTSNKPKNRDTSDRSDQTQPDS